MGAVSSSTNAISDDVLDLALNQNPMNSLKSQVELRFEAENLKNLDCGTKSDPFVVLWSIQDGRKTRLGETEVMADNLNPKWVKAINVTYYFEMQ